jgi:glycosyltransferase involved in cell wall biosynthesis
LSRSGCDIVHCYDYLQFQTLATMLAAASPKLQRPSVVTIFDVQHMVPRPPYKSLPIALADRLSARQVSARFDRILVRAPNLIGSLVSVGFEREKMVVTQSGVRDELLEPGDGQAFRDSHGLDGNVLLYLGRLNPTKGLIFLLDAASEILSQHPDTQIVIIGPDEKGHRKELEGRALSQGIEHNIVFLDPIYGEGEKRDALSACDIFVLPSGYEGTSQSVMQAMAQGKPVVTTNVGGLPYLIRDGFDGFLVPYASPPDLASKINQLLDSPTARRRMGKRAKERARRQFLYSQLAKQLVEIYQGLLSV